MSLTRSVRACHSFINHAPGAAANLVLQPVFSRCKGTDRRCLYRTALFACREIAPFEELVYDYGPDYAWDAPPALPGAAAAREGVEAAAAAALDAPGSGPAAAAGAESAPPA